MRSAADILRRHVRQDLEDVVRLGRLVVVARHVDRLLHLVRVGIDPRVMVLHAVARAHLAALELLDHRQVVGRAGLLDATQQLAGGHVAVVVHVTGHADRHARVLLLVRGHELLHARQVEAVVPGRAEHAEDGVGAEAVDVGPVLLVVDPGEGFVQLGLHHLLAQRLDVVAADRGGHHVGLDLL